MNKKIKTLRDLSLVEKELSSIQSGVLAVTLQKDTFVQFATNFVYQNKNIFVFINNAELLRTIKFDSPAKFTILREKNTTKELLEENMTFALEPKFVIPGTGAVGVENSYLVTNNAVEKLTLFEENIIQL